MRKRRIREMRNLDVPTDEYGHPIDEIILEPRKRQRKTTEIIIWRNLENLITTLENIVFAMYCHVMPCWAIFNRNLY